MKKLAMLLILGLLAGSAMADVIDGDFTIGTDFFSTGSNPNHGNPGKWYAYNSTDNVWDDANDRVQFLASGSYRAVGQTLDQTTGGWGASDTILRIGYDVQGDGVDLVAAVWGETATFGWNGGGRMYDPLVSGGDPGNVLLGSVALTDMGTSSGTVDVALNLAGTLDNYNEIQVIFSIRGADNDAGYITSAHLVPEPATMALLGLGGLGMLIRRKR